MALKERGVPRGLSLARGFLLLSVVLCVASCCTPRAPKRVVALNLDCTQMQYDMPADEVDARGVTNYYHRLNKGGLTHLLINPNAQCTVYESKVSDPVWHADPRVKPESSRYPQFDRSRILAEKGVDYIRILVDLCRRDGVSPWITMRMNDIHGIGSDANWSRSKFWLDHPEYWRVPHKDKAKMTLFDADLALDYTHAGVRGHKLALAREMLEKWDVDGFECDWTRFPHHVNEAAERDRSGAMAVTAFMRELRKIADEIGARRGRRIRIGARVASMPEAAIGLGTDAEGWAREGLVDAVSPCNFFNNADFALPWADWKRRLAAANPRVRLVAGIDFAGVSRDDYWNPQGFTVPEFAACLERISAAGIGDFETFNRFAYSEGEINRFVQVDGMPDPAGWTARHDRTYPVTYHDAVPAGFDNERRLPTTMDAIRPLRVSVGRVGAAKAYTVVMAFDGAVRPTVTLNGVAARAVREDPVARWLPGAKNAKKVYVGDFPVSAAVDGPNDIVVSADVSSARLFYVALHLGKGTE